MDTSFAALLYREAEVSEEALVQGFAVALGGWDVPAPELAIAPLRSLAGSSAAFYRSGARLGGDDELDHACEVFEDDLPPAACVLDAVADLGGAPTVYAVTYGEALLHDDAWRFGPRDVERRFIREG